MNRTTKRLTAFFLCLTMLVGALCMTVSAEKAGRDDSCLKYRYYTYVGDSVSWGYGLDEKLDPLAASSVFVPVENAFAGIVGKVLKENNPDAQVVCAACNGGRLADFRMALESGMGISDPYIYPDDVFGMRSYERTMLLQGSGDYLVDNLKKSDLVTVTLGANDLASVLVNTVCALDFVDFDKIQSLTDTASKLEYAIYAIQAAAKQKNMLGDVMDALKDGVAGLRENQAEVVKDIVGIAPDDADILLVGYFVPMDRFRLLPGTDSSFLMEILGTVFTLYNDAFEKIASEYSNVYYVDAPDADIFFEEGTLLTDALALLGTDSDSFLLGIHPNADGQKYISERVLDKLVEINTARQPQTTAALPVRTITYVVETVAKAVNNAAKTVKGIFSSVFKR